MARKKKVKSTLPDEDSPFVEFDAAYLVKRLALFKGVLLRRAIRKDCASYHFTATPEGKVTVAVTNLNEGLLLNLDVLKCTGVGTVMVDAFALNALLGGVRRAAVPAAPGRPGPDPRRLHPDQDGPARLRPRQGAQGDGTAVPDHTRAGSCGAVPWPRPWTWSRSPATPKSTRYALSGVALVFPAEQGGMLELVTTDGRRLSRYRIPVKPHGQDPARLARPGEWPGRRACPSSPTGRSGWRRSWPGWRATRSVAFCVMPAEPEDLTKEKFAPGRIQVVTRDAVLTASGPEGRFPRYQDVGLEQRAHGGRHARTMPAAWASSWPVP